MSEMTRRRRMEEERRRTGTAPVMQMPQENAQQMTPEPAITQARAVRTAEEEAAYNLGAKMGAQRLAGTAPAEQNRRGGVDKDRLIEAERLLMEYKKGKASVDRRIINAQDWWKMRN